MATVVEVFESGVACVKKVSTTKDQFRSWLQSKGKQKVGKPKHGSACPLYEFFSQACPELRVVSVGSNVAVSPVSPRAYLEAREPEHYGLQYDDTVIEASGYAQQSIELPDWCKTFVYRLDEGWSDMEEGGITGELALGILDRAEDEMPERGGFSIGLNEKAFRAVHLPETLPVSSPS